MGRKVPMAQNHNRPRSGRNGSGIDLATVPGNIPPQPNTPSFGIELPPDEIYKFRQRRENVAQAIMENNSFYPPDYAEYIEGKGCFVHYCRAMAKDGQVMIVRKDFSEEGMERLQKQGWKALPTPPPSICVATVDSIQAVNQVKRDVITYFKLGSFKETRWLVTGFVLMGKKNRRSLLSKTLDLFNLKADLVLAPFYLKDGFYCPLAREVRGFVRSVLLDLGVSYEVADRTAECMGCMFEYDNAYRFRFRDLFSETSKERLLENLPKELERLLQILASREAVSGGAQVVERFQSAAKVIKYLWMLPGMKKTLRKAIRNMEIDKCKLDDSEIYHTLMYGDYNVQGKTQQERFAIYSELHGPDVSKWPPRVEIRARQA
jgi:hypothetical protein